MSFKKVENELGELGAFLNPDEYKLFENYQKCRIWIFKIRHFLPIFVFLKFTYLVTLFDRKLYVFKNSPK